MANYTKLFNSIVTSTIWTEDDKTRIVWITMLAICDQNGEVQASIPGLARLSGVSVADAEMAIGKLLSPDKHSRTPDFDGRRIVPIDGGWELLNHAKYRRMASLEDRKEATAKRVKRHRARNANVTQCNAPVTHSNADVTLLPDKAEAEAEAEAEADTQENRGGNSKEIAPAPVVDNFDGLTARSDLHSLMARINSLHPTWQKPAQWNRMEMEDLKTGTGKQLQELTDEDWETLRDYLSKPEDKEFWRPRNRSKFVQTFPDVWQSCQRWQQKQPAKTKEGERSVYR